MSRILSFPSSVREGNPVIRSTYRDLDHEEVCPEFEPRSARDLWAIRRQFDVAAFHWGYDRMGWRRGVELIAGVKALRKRVIWHAHEVDIRGRVGSARRGRLGMVLNHLLYRSADGIVYYSQDGKDRLARRWGRTRAMEIVAVHPPIRMGPPPADGATLRSRYGVPQNAFVYGFFGAVRPYKGLPELVRAYRKVRDDRTALVIAGHFDPLDPMPRRDLETLLQACDQDVYYRLNGIRDESVPIVMAMLDAVVLPYQSAETSGVFYLAMESGKPVVAPNQGIWREIVEPTCGILYTDLIDGLIQARSSTFHPRYPEDAYRRGLAKLNGLYRHTNDQRRTHFDH